MPVEQMTTEAIERELNRLGCVGQFGPRMEELEAELRVRYGVLGAARDVVR